MSHRVEYQWGAFRVPGGAAGTGADRFVVAIEGGGSNLCHPRTGRRMRSWGVWMIGTADQVLRQAVRRAGACADGGLQPHGRCCTPEAYIGRIRALIEGPAHLREGWWRPQLRIDAAHPAVADARQLGLEPAIQQWHGLERAVVAFPPERLPEFFRLVDLHGDGLPAWCFAEAGGLPQS